MLRTILSFISISLAIPLTAQTFEVVSDPQGLQVFECEPGYTPIGITLVRPWVFSGTIESVTADTVTFAGTNITLDTYLDAGVAYYMEVTDVVDSEYEGDRWEVNATLTVADDNATMTLDMTNAWNTVATLPDLSGAHVFIRPHWTFATLFGTGDDAQLTGTASFTTADAVLLFDLDNQAFVSASYISSGAFNEFLSGSTNVTNDTIYPGQGVVIQNNQAVNATISYGGEVRTNDFAQPLIAGYNFITEGRPISSTPTERQMLPAGTGAWFGALSQPTSDQAIFWNGSSFGDTYWLADTGTSQFWFNTATGGTDYVNEEIIDHRVSYFIFRQNAGPLNFAPNEFPEL